MGQSQGLQALFESRRKALDAAEAGLGGAQQERRRCASALADAQRRLEEAEAAVRDRARLERERQRAGFRGGQWQQERRYQQRLRATCGVRAEAVRVAQGSLQGAEQAEQNARAAVLEARRELEVLEKHREREEARRRKERNRREEAEADDLTTSRFGRE